MDNNEKKNPNKRFLGKLQTVKGQYGDFQKIMIDNISAQSKDGTPNKYFEGALIWGDAKTGKNYQVKQLKVFVPKDGMPQSAIDRGFSCYITLDLDDDFQVTVLG